MGDLSLEQAQMVSHFSSVTGAPENFAKTFLQDNGWQLEAGVNQYMVSRQLSTIPQRHLRHHLLRVAGWASLNFASGTHPSSEEGRNAIRVNLIRCHGSALHLFLKLCIHLSFS
jgi:hypothetical protein